MAPRSSITKRWLFNSFGIIVVIMVLMVIGVSAAMHSFYYNSASQYIRTRAAAVNARLENAAADAGSTSIDTAMLTASRNARIRFFMENPP